MDFAGLARSAGYAQVHDFSELKSFEQQVGHVLSQEGPVFATLHVKKNRPLVYKYDDLYKASRRVALKAALQEDIDRRDEARIVLQAALCARHRRASQ